jgi:hypothetical protein
MMNAERKSISLYFIAPRSYFIIYFATPCTFAITSSAMLRGA